MRCGGNAGRGLVFLFPVVWSCAVGAWEGGFEAGDIVSLEGHLDEGGGGHGEQEEKWAHG